MAQILTLHLKLYRLDCISPLFISILVVTSLVSHNICLGLAEGPLCLNQWKEFIF